MITIKLNMSIWGLFVFSVPDLTFMSKWCPRVLNNWRKGIKRRLKFRGPGMQLQMLKWVNGIAIVTFSLVGQGCCVVTSRTTALQHLLLKRSFLSENYLVFSLIRHSHFTFAEFQRRTVTRNACKAVQSVSESCFDIRFNPDVCNAGNKHTVILLSPKFHYTLMILIYLAKCWSIYYTDVAVVRFPSECVAQVHEQRLLLWNVAAFLLSHQIPAVVRIILYESQIMPLPMTSTLMQHVFLVAEGLSGPHGGTDGRPNPDCGAASARAECPVPGHTADGAGAGRREGKTPPHTGCYCCNPWPLCCFCIWRISSWIVFFFCRGFRSARSLSEVPSTFFGPFSR